MMMTAHPPPTSPPGGFILKVACVEAEEIARLAMELEQAVRSAKAEQRKRRIAEERLAAANRRILRWTRGETSSPHKVKATHASTTYAPPLTSSSSQRAPPLRSSSSPRGAAPASRCTALANGGGVTDSAIKIAGVNTGSERALGGDVHHASGISASSPRVQPQHCAGRDAEKSSQAIDRLRAKDSTISSGERSGKQQQQLQIQVGRTPLAVVTQEEPEAFVGTGRSVSSPRSRSGCSNGVRVRSSTSPSRRINAAGSEGRIPLAVVTQGETEAFVGRGRSVSVSRSRSGCSNGVRGRSSTSPSRRTNSGEEVREKKRPWGSSPPPETHRHREDRAAVTASEAAEQRRRRQASNGVPTSRRSSLNAKNIGANGQGYSRRRPSGSRRGEAGSSTAHEEGPPRGKRRESGRCEGVAREEVGIAGATVVGKDNGAYDSGRTRSKDEKLLRYRGGGAADEVAAAAEEAAEEAETADDARSAHRHVLNVGDRNDAVMSAERIRDTGSDGSIVEEISTTARVQGKRYGEVSSSDDGQTPVGVDRGGLDERAASATARENSAAVIPDTVAADLLGVDLTETVVRELRLAVAGPSDATSVSPVERPQGCVSGYRHAATGVGRGNSTLPSRLSFYDPDSARNDRGLSPHDDAATGTTSITMASTGDTTGRHGDCHRHRDKSANEARASTGESSSAPNNSSSGNNNGNSSSNSNSPRLAKVTTTPTTWTTLSGNSGGLSTQSMAKSRDVAELESDLRHGIHQIFTTRGGVGPDGDKSAGGRESGGSDRGNDFTDGAAPTAPRKGVDVGGNEETEEVNGARAAIGEALALLGSIGSVGVPVEEVNDCGVVRDEGAGGVQKSRLDPPSSGGA